MHPRNITLVFAACAALSAVGCGRALAPDDQVQLTLAAAPSASESGKVSLDVLQIDAEIDGAWTTLSHKAASLELGLGSSPTAEALGSIDLPAGHLTALRFTLNVEPTLAKQKRAGEGNHTVTLTAACDHQIPHCVSGMLALQIENLLALLEEIVGQNPILQLISADLDAKECKPDMKKPEVDASMPPRDMAAFDAAGLLCVGVICAPDETCRSGQCVPLDSCTGVVCAPGQVCVSGECIVPTDMAHAVDMSEPGDMTLGCGGGGTHHH